MLFFAALLAISTGEAKVTVTDDVGRKVELEKPPQRIVSTAPSNTEALFALGAGDRVVGVTIYCVSPEEAKSRTKVGDFSTIDFERVLSLKPDLVVATWREQKRHVERMERLGLEVLVLYPDSIEKTMQSLLTLGRAIGSEAEAQKLVEEMGARLEVIDARLEDKKMSERPRVFVELGASPLYTAGPGSTVHEVIERAGGRNVAADLGKPYATISREVVIERDPEVIVVGMASKDEIENLHEEPGFDGLSAVRNKRVHLVDPALLFHHNHLLLDGIEHLYALFYPDIETK